MAVVETKLPVLVMGMFRYDRTALFFVPNLLDFLPIQHQKRNPGRVRRVVDITHSTGFYRCVCIAKRYDKTKTRAQIRGCSDVELWIVEPFDRLVVGHSQFWHFYLLTRPLFFVRVSRP